MKSILLIKMFFGLVEMMFRLVNVSFSLLKWQAVKMTYLQPVVKRELLKRGNWGHLCATYSCNSKVKCDLLVRKIIVTCCIEKWPCILEIKKFIHCIHVPVVYTSIIKTPQ